MPKPGFNRNKGTIRRILRDDLGGIAATKAAAEAVRDQIVAGLSAEDAKRVFIKKYWTDRAVWGVAVPADLQAKHGAATRAASQAGLQPG